jgi:selenide,water dikinase
MGGKALTALNLVLCPSATIDIWVLKQILRGGADKVKEAGAVVAGSHCECAFLARSNLALTTTAGLLCRRNRSSQ